MNSIIAVTGIDGVIKRGSGTGKNYSVITIISVIGPADAMTATSEADRIIADAA